MNLQFLGYGLDNVSDSVEMRAFHAVITHLLR